MFRTIVVGIDGSPGARHALAEAIGIATSSGAVLHLVAADEKAFGRDVERAKATLPPEFRPAFDAHADTHEYLADAAFAVRQAGVEARTYDVRAHPADALLDVADEVDADLIVVGSRGRGVTKRHLLGSVSTRVTHHTHRSILVVHGPAGAADPT